MKTKKDLMSMYEDKTDRRDIRASVIEFLTGGEPVGAIMKIIDNYSKTHLFNKVSALYINAEGSVDTKKNKNFRDKLSRSRDYRKAVGLIIIELVDRLATDSNVDVLANLYISCADDLITEDQFIRLAITLQRCTYSDLIRLPNYYVSNSNFKGVNEMSSTDVLLAAGFLTEFTIGGGESTYQLNHLGLDMVTYGLKHQFEV